MITLPKPGMTQNSVKTYAQYAFHPQQAKYMFSENCSAVSPQWTHGMSAGT